MPTNTLHELDGLDNVWSLGGTGSLGLVPPSLVYMKVVISTNIRKADPLIASSGMLVFKTLRTGFPSAKIEVWDNCSIEPFRTEIAHETLKLGGQFHPLDQRILYHDFIRARLSANEPGSLALVDTDIIFYDDVQSWGMHQHELLMGRLIPLHRNEVYGCTENSRLHSSLLFIRDVQELNKTIAKEFSGPCAASGYQNPWAPTLWFNGGFKYFHDVGCNIYQAFPSTMRAFTETQLDSYTHLHCGTWLDQVLPHIKKADQFKKVHELATTDRMALHGLWRQQDEYYREH